jgi:pre-mRNA cleavage complex 2 protein Pcf11
MHNPSMVGMNSNANSGDIAQLMGSLQQRSSTPTYPQTSALQGPPAIRSPMPQTAVPVPRQAYNGTPTNYGAPYQPPPAVSQQQLQNDVRQILLSANFQKTLDPSDSRTQQLISTLENLKAILDSQQFDSTQLQVMQTELSKISGQIQSQIAALIGGNPLPVVTPAPAPPSTLSQYPIYSTPPPTMTLPPAFATQPPSANIISIPPNLASLLGAFPPPQPSNGSSSQAGGDNPLLAQLRAAGLLPSTPTPEPIVNPKISGSHRFGVDLDQESITKM